MNQRTLPNTQKKKTQHKPLFWIVFINILPAHQSLRNMNDNWAQVLLFVFLSKYIRTPWNLNHSSCSYTNTVLEIHLMVQLIWAVFTLVFKLLWKQLAQVISILGAMRMFWIWWSVMQAAYALQQLVFLVCLLNYVHFLITHIKGWSCGRSICCRQNQEIRNA